MTNPMRLPMTSNEIPSSNDSEKSAIDRLHYFVARRLGEIEARLSQITKESKAPANSGLARESSSIPAKGSAEGTSESAVSLQKSIDEDAFSRDFVIDAMMEARGGAHSPEALRRRVCEQIFDGFVRARKERLREGSGE